VTRPVAPGPWRDAVVTLLDGSHQTGPFDLGLLVADAVAPTGARVAIYLIDREQRHLRPLPPTGGRPQTVDDTPAGQAFTTLRPVIDPSRTDWWVPIVNGTERLGVLRVTAPDEPDPDRLRAGALLFAGLVGHLITAKNEYGDDIERVRRSRPMTPAAELLWRLLPPLTFSSRQLAVTAVLEPCYEAGGDAFDYAVDQHTARITVYDGVGKGLRAALTTGTAIGAVRATRRAGSDIVASADAADAALRGEFSDARFVTAVLAELDLDEGSLRYVNAGHPPPVLFRGGQAVLTLTEGNRTPLGVERGPVRVGEAEFEPGDRLLIYTDGVTEARDATGAFFGLDRLVKLTEELSARDLPPADVLRRLSHAVLAHQPGPPRDDAALVVVEWSPDAARRSVP
jgi:phosphoserine phosphatase RsbU/P